VVGGVPGVGGEAGQQQARRGLAGIHGREDGGHGVFSDVEPHAGVCLFCGVAKGLVKRVWFGPGRGGAGPVGSEATGLDEGDGDPEPGDLLGERFGQPFQRPLGGVVDAQAGEGDDAREAGYLQDVPAALLAEQRDGRLGDPQGAEQVGLDLAAHLGFGQLLDESEMAIAGVIDHHIEAAEMGVGALDSGDTGRAVGDIQGDRQDRVTELGG
jgi:hypothetical protein